jgi:D-alanyl-D-alanine dipeptidase
MLTKIDPTRVDIDLRYATADNITGAPLYGRALCLLHPEAAAALHRAAAIAEGVGLRLLVWDAFRPVEAQWALWRALPDPRWVAGPRRGSHHNRGVAVDLTLAGRAMGTRFDEATPQSAHGATDIPEEAQRNRLMLAGIMTAAGWELDAFEWWHYQLPEAFRYPVLSDSVLGADRMM